MIEFQEALDIVMKAGKPLGNEIVPLIKARGRVLGQDVFLDLDVPPFDKSAMDGFACRKADLDSQLKVVETIPAGHAPEKKVGPGECAKIMTGAMVPEGADCVVMVEHTREADSAVQVIHKTGPTNICRKAEDLAKGDKVLDAGSRLGPVEIAVLASTGTAQVRVAKRPNVGIIATGSELVEPDQTPGKVQIRNSNSYQLWSQIERAGVIPHYFGIAPDEPRATEQMLEKALPECEVILVSGGVSMGDYDYVPGVLRKVGVNLMFEKIAIKPGKPTVFGIKENAYFFGLPGNPVSTFVLFEKLVKPFLYRLMGHFYQPLRVRAKLDTEYKRKKVERLGCIPVALQAEGTAAPVEYHGSAHIHSYVNAHGIVEIPIGVGEIKAGEEVMVEVIGDTVIGDLWRVDSAQR